VSDVRAGLADSNDPGGSTEPLNERVEGLAWPLLLLLVGISAIGPVTMNGVLPATSAVMIDLQTSYGTAQLVLTVFLIATFAAQIVLGRAADRYGRRPVMVFGLAVFTVGSLLCSISPNIEALLAGRFVQGFGASVCVFLPRTIVRDAWSRDRAASVIGWMTTAMMVAPLFGPALGGWVTDTLDWHWMYRGLALIGLVFTLLAALFQRETLGMSSHARSATSVASVAVPVTAGKGAVTEAVTGAGAVVAHGATGRPGQPGPARDPGAMRLLWGEASFRSLALLLAGSVGVYYSFLAGAPYLAMERRGMAASDYGLWFGMVGIGYLAGNLVAGSLSARLGAFRMIRLGLVPMGAGIVAFWLASGSTHPVALFLPMQLFAFSNGMSLPNVISAAMSVRPELAGTASGLAGSLQTGSGVLLTLAIGFVLPSGDLWLPAAMSLCVLLAFYGALSSPDIELFSAARR